MMGRSLNAFVVICPPCRQLCKPPGAVSIMCLTVAKRQDIAGVTERRKRLESLRRMSAEWQFLITLNEQLRSLKDPVAIQEAAVRSIGEHLHASRVNYAHIDG